ncbi:hypothetical protein B0I35DRAFT_24257 [Stachybotrys elegans]|uniref:J domain-containing protein n=1 Tax=Stachybotrys elegans TaxID=80388 RepID=A0A8K0T1Z9_9HYPO|nr:hypothetical protein B0I35DRAFT_24257 [Stachybotrys elegans]
MRPVLPSAARDISRVCNNCRIQARRQTSSLARAASAPIPRTSLRGPLAPQQLQRQQPRRLLSQSAHVRASAAPADSPAEPPSSEPRPRTHYDLFPETLPAGPPPAGHFPVDTRALRREFLRLQASAHPDMHPAESKAAAESASALINEAYRTLSNPLLRAQYLLSLRGVDVAEDESLKVDEPDLLMEVLEAREEIAAAESESDLEEPRARNNERIAESEGALEQAFQADDVDVAKREAVRLRYWVNIKESLDNWERGKPIVLEH